VVSVVVTGDDRQLRRPSDVQGSDVGEFDVRVAVEEPDGFDCSGLTMYVYAQLGISLPHYAASQYGMGVAVGRDQLQAGDLVFFRGLGHMGMYIGGGNFIHAPHTGDVVKISSLSDSYYASNWVGARRVV
jgi:peptidoglycan DL-endopeptidase CwlO